MSRSRRAILSCVALLGLAASLAAAPQKPVDPKDASTVARITMIGFQKMHEAGEVLVVDVRDAQAFALGRIPGALNVPLAEMERRAQEVKDKAGTKIVVTYCSCPAEHSSAEAGLILHKHGVQDVRALVGGYVEWVRSGGKIERGLSDR